MSFITIAFICFLFIVLFLWAVLPFKAGKTMLCIASLIFYGYWYPPVLLLLIFSGLFNFLLASNIYKSKSPRKLLILGVSVNVGILFSFKYVSFFVTSLSGLFSLFERVEYADISFNIILPLGISFYTFEAICYLVDIYNKKLLPSNSLKNYFLYAAFFPHLVAGPIVRASEFLPQLDNKHTVSSGLFIQSIYRIARGYFLKVVIADNIAVYVNSTFLKDPMILSTCDAWFGALCFTAQIFSDFAGYSDIAIGVAGLFGICLSENFSNPYFASSLNDFWKRWHISLSTWIRDYIYIPLGGSYVPRLRASFNMIVSFTLSGLWHGANWTFVIWGFLHGLLASLEKNIRARVIRLNQWDSNMFIIRVFKVSFTLIIVIILWVPFRAQTIQYTWMYWQRLFTLSDLSFHASLTPILILALFIIQQGFQFYKELYKFKPSNRLFLFEAILYFILILLIPGESHDFIYFQF